MNYLSAFFRYLTAPLRLLVTAPMKLIGAPRRLMGLSLPMRVAVLLAFFLVLLTLVHFVANLLIKDTAHWGELFRLPRLLAIVVLLVVIPVLVYQVLRLWLEGDLSRYPEIDEAWRAGLIALEEQGLDLTQIPLFTILGARNERDADNIMRASGLELLVHSIPSGRAPLRWYANDRAIFLFCPATGCLGSLNKGGSVASGVAEAGGGTMPAQNITGTMIAGEPGIADSGPVPATADAWADGGGGGGGTIRGTLQPDISGTMVPGQAGPAPAPGGGTRTLTRRDLDEECDRLGYICQLLRRARQPLCPLNGLLMLLPLDAVRDVLVAKDMPEAIRRDLASIRDSAQMACGVTVLVTGMESESGFSELIRRVGSSKSKSSRFGKGFNVRNSPSGENLEALSGRACGSFEDWVYALFRDEEGLDKPGNGKLYALLCMIRSQLLIRIRNILVRGFSCDPADGGDEHRQELFSGLYFAATGDTADRQAFVRSVMDKMIQLEEDIEWEESAFIEDDRFHQWARFGMVVNGVLLVALGALLVYRFYWR